MKFGLFIVARNGSVRLPKKHLLKHKNIKMIEILISRVLKTKKINRFILITTKKKEDDIFKKITKKMGISIFRGDELNVKKRLYDAAKKFKIEKIVLINGDRPLSDPKIINYALNIFKRKKLKILTTRLKQTFPKGFDLDIFTTKKLEESFEYSKTDDDFEHITNVFFRYKKTFKVYNLCSPKKYFMPKLSYLLDYKKDYLKIKKLLDQAYKIKKNYLIDCENIIKISKKI